MGKKNPFVTTVGFNRHDPAHVEVAQFLNGMERGKAQYIVDAVMAYQNGGQAGVSVLSGAGSAGAMETAQQAETFGENGLTGLDDNALGGILQSLEAFKG